MNHPYSTEIQEPSRSTPVVRSVDVAVSGGGPAGVAAALASARAGARTLLVESQGCLGGVWTSGALCCILDYRKKTGIMPELFRRLEAMDARAKRPDGTPTNGYDVEAMKVLLERMCRESGVIPQLHTRVCGAFFRPNTNRLSHLLLESTGGREAVEAKVFIDATGNGDLAARAGCGFDLGRPDDGLTQPMSLMAILTGIEDDDLKPFFRSGKEPGDVVKTRLRKAMEEAGVSPSYTLPTLFRLPHGLYALMANHQYEGNGTRAEDLTRHTMDAREEIHSIIDHLRAAGGIWKNLTLVGTAAHIGIREGRRVHGLYTVSEKDVVEGARHPDAVCRANFGVDVHSVRKADGGGYSGEGRKAQPYDIPYRALVARDVEGLLLAGRCISGDFFAHASYRVTGNAVAMGEAAGLAAAECARRDLLPSEFRPPPPESRAKSAESVNPPH